MSSLRDSFADVADWCERHLETRHGREVGMTFGAVIRAYGQLATRPAEHDVERESLECRRLDGRAEAILFDFCTRFIVAHGFRKDQPRPVQPDSQITNMIYDPGP